MATTSELVFSLTSGESIYDRPEFAGYYDDCREDGCDGVARFQERSIYAKCDKCGTEVHAHCCGQCIGIED